MTDDIVEDMREEIRLHTTQIAAVSSKVETLEKMFDKMIALLKWTITLLVVGFGGEGVKSFIQGLN